MGEKMRAIVVEQYGGIDKLVGREVPKPAAPEGEDVLVQSVCIAFLTIDTKADSMMVG